MENRTQKFCSVPLLFFSRFDHDAALKIEPKLSHLNIAFDRYASIGTVLHYVLVISFPLLFLQKKVFNFIRVVLLFMKLNVNRIWQLSNSLTQNGIYMI